MSLAGIVSGAAAQAHVTKDDREAWLQAAWAGIQSLYAAQGVTLPDASLSVGVPPTAARCRTKARAESVPVAVWGGKKAGYEIHVNPKHLDSTARAIGALFHAALIITGKPQPQGTKALIDSLAAPPGSIADSQHVDANSAGGLAGNAKQSTRLLRASCGSCRFVCRVTRKQAARGLPICGVCYPQVIRLELK